MRNIYLKCGMSHCAKNEEINKFMTLPEAMDGKDLSDRLYLSLGLPRKRAHLSDAKELYRALCQYHRSKYSSEKTGSLSANKTIFWGRECTAFLCWGGGYCLMSYGGGGILCDVIWGGM
jgi:hypothetical protein